MSHFCSHCKCLPLLACLHPHRFITQLLAFVSFFVFHSSAAPQNKETPAATHPGFVLDVPGEGDGVVRFLFHFGDGVEALFVISCRNMKQDEVRLQTDRQTGRQRHTHNHRHTHSHMDKYTQQFCEYTNITENLLGPNPVHEY